MHGTPFDARPDVEFGVVLEGDLVPAAEGEDSGEDEHVEGGGSAEGEGRDGEGAGPGLGGDEGIEMMELGGEREWEGWWWCCGVVVCFRGLFCFSLLDRYRFRWHGCRLFPMLRSLLLDGSALLYIQA